jgi:hypothetical protein
MKNYFQLQNSADNHVKKTKKTNARKIDGECLTETAIIERIRELEEEKKQKKKLEFSAEDIDDDDSERLRTSSKIKLNKCKKCRTTFHDKMLACENSSCAAWLCIET